MSMFRNTGERFEVATEQTGYIMPDIFTRDGPPVFAQQSVRVGENRSHRAAGVAPFVNDLLQYTRVRVLRDKTGTQHLDAFARDFFHHRRVVEEPPATEWHQVREFARVDAELMLVFE